MAARKRRKNNRSLGSNKPEAIMILSSADSHRFYQIWWPLLKFVNTQQHVVENFPKDPELEGLNLEDATKVRNVLWNSPDLLDEFIQANPAGLSEPDLQLAASWKHRFFSQFVIIRHLKKYSIFLRHEEPPVAFGVLGIISPLQEVVGHYLPVMADAVLLPFEGKIIYDSLIVPYQVSFGPGLRKRFNHAYRMAQELHGVKTTLSQDYTIADNRGAVAKGNQKILLAFRRDLAAVGLSEKMLEVHYASVENFVNAYLLQSNPPRSLLNVQAKDLDNYFRSQGQQANRVSFKRLVRFLFNSARISGETAKELEDFLKSL
jgi:hypothetical protein